MHIHLPKPLHGWRALLGEIGVIFVGIMLALGAEGLVERAHWREQAEIANEGIGNELGNGAWASYERLIVQPCLHGQLERVRERLLAGETAWKGMSYTSTITDENPRAVLPVYAPPSRSMIDDVWTGAVAQGTTSHMETDRVNAISGIYAQMHVWEDSQRAEAEAASRLSPLAYDGPIDQGLRNDMLAALAEVDRLDRLMALVSGQIIESIRNLKLEYDPEELREVQAELVKKQTEYRGACVRRNLPFKL